MMDEVLLEGVDISGNLVGSKLSILIPAYNEAPFISKAISETKDVMHHIGLNYEIVIVDDGSKDKTYEESSKFLSENVKVVRYEENGGKGKALRHGFNYVSGDLVTFLDADLDLHPYQISTFLKYMADNNADVVIGSKRHPLSNLDYPAHRRFLSRGYNLLTRVLFGLNVKDTQAGIKLFKKDVLEKIFPKILVKRYAFDLEVLVNVDHLGYKLIEAPIDLDFQRVVGRIKIKDIARIAMDTAAIFYRHKFLKYYDRR